ncbi:MAG: recombination protein RecR [Bacteroidales bacterium]|nr:recombination protein RecR [Bacteroidales bacterium]MBO7229657.1 recombination protein RecR [Bacteroidales bacterium]
MEYSSSVLEKAVNELAKLPGVGEKTALRYALWLLKQSDEQVDSMIRSISDLKTKIHQCQKCNNLSDMPTCSICSDKSRNESLVCVVATIKDVMAIENTGYYRGLYHVLDGVISPLEGIGVNDIKIEHLLFRIENEPIEEVILALPTTMEGDTTAFYINKLIEGKKVKVSAVSRGISMGDSIEYADEQTLARSISLRLPFDEIYNH